MKKITYEFLSAEIINEDISEKVFITKQMILTDKDFVEALPFIEKEAYNGEYLVEEIAEPTIAPTQLDIIEAQVVYTAMMTGTLMEV